MKLIKYTPLAQTDTDSAYGLLENEDGYLYLVRVGPGYDPGGDNQPDHAWHSFVQVTTPVNVTDELYNMDEAMEMPADRHLRAFPDDGWDDHEAVKALILEVGHQHQMATRLRPPRVGGGVE